MGCAFSSFFTLPAHYYRLTYAPDSASSQIPYLPVDPNDIGATYEAVIRVNS